jgi:hypothetical protein
MALNDPFDSKPNRDQISNFFSDWDLRRRQKRFNKGAVAADGHGGKAFVLVSMGNLGIGVEPGRQRFEGVCVDTPLFNPQKQMRKEGARNILALNFRHQEPA